MKLRHIAIAAAVLASASLPAVAEEYVCNGSVGAISLDNIFVPDGARCELKGTRAKGNVVVGTGAKLLATSIKINGNVQAEGADHVGIGGNSSIGGSVQIVSGGSATVDKALIKGSIQLKSNNGKLRVRQNVVDQDLQVFENTGGVVLRDNRIDGNLQCKENHPAPVGGGNRAASKEDQCERL